MTRSFISSICSICWSIFCWSITFGGSLGFLKPAVSQNEGAFVIFSCESANSEDMEEGYAALNDSERQRLVWPTAGGAHYGKHPEVKRGGIQNRSFRNALTFLINTKMHPLSWCAHKKQPDPENQGKNVPLCLRFSTALAVVFLC